MVSILIPVFNEDVRALAHELSTIGANFNEPVEIIFLDDGSHEDFKEINAGIINLPFVDYSEAERNYGRSGIRNKLAAKAAGEWLWFLDCDSRITNNQNILFEFIKHAEKNKIISGGRIYQEEPPSEIKKKLHWKWGSERELIDPISRMKDPVNHFLSNNFFIHKSAFESIRFDEGLFGYGYEDTLFAAEAVKQKIQIIHINNPVLHDGLEPTDQFLKKIEQSLDNLFRLKDLCQEKKIPFPVKSKLVLAYRILRMPVIYQLLGNWFVRNKNIWRIQLNGPNPSLKTFDAWRLSCLLSS
ncbi:MAG: glycosyltransferase [Bacteroidia bacterium]